MNIKNDPDLCVMSAVASIKLKRPLIIYLDIFHASNEHCALYQQNIIVNYFISQQALFTETTKKTQIKTNFTNMSVISCSFYSKESLRYV